MRWPSRPRASGFTLVELLLVCLIIPIVSMAVYGNFSAGLRLWSTLQRQTPYEETDILTRRATHDFNNAVKYALIPFSVDGTRVDFACFTPATDLFGGADAIGRVAYYYDKSAKVLMREEKNISQAYTDAPGRVSRVFSNVDGFSMQFFALDPIANAYLWTEEWDPSKEKLPSAIRFNIESGGSTLVRTFHLPGGGS